MGQGTEVSPYQWVLFTLILSRGTFGSEGKKFQQDTGETPRWLPLPADPTPGAEKDSEVNNQRRDHLTLADQTPETKKPGDKDLVHQKKEEHILKRRQGFYQVDIEEIRCQTGV